MKKAVVTILGLVSATKLNSDKSQNNFVQKTEKDKAEYVVENRLKTLLNPPKNIYTNMFALLVDTFRDLPVVAIATKKSIEIQKDVLVFENLSKYIDYREINELENYHNTFATINKILEEFDEVIIDLSHGFRHLPLLTFIALLVQNIKQTDKIKSILFAEEIEKDRRYKIVDLVEYLDIATLSYALASFKQNYTLINKDNLRTYQFKNLFETLSRFSEAILANSLKSVFEGSLIDEILASIDRIENESSFLKDARLLEDVKKHLYEIKELSSKDEYIKYFEIGKKLLDRGYILNSVTILNEALPLYLHKRFDELKILSKFAQDTSYDTLSDIANFLKTENMNPRLFNDKIDSHFYYANYEIFGKIYHLYEELKTTRNDLAHASGEKVYADIKQSIETLFGDFQSDIIDSDIAKNLNLKIDENSKYKRYNRKHFEEKLEAKYQELFPEEQANPNVIKKLLKDGRACRLNGDKSEDRKLFTEIACAYWKKKEKQRARMVIIDRFYDSFD